MSIFSEVPPTAGFPIHLKDLFSFNQAGSLEKDFSDYLGVDFARVTYSGTAAFFLILESLKNLSPKKTVVISSYICPLVALAVKRAGLKIRVCDIEKESFNFDYACLEKICREDDDILAVVAVHLAGVPIELKKIILLAKEKKFFLIEDCAQGLGAEIEGKKIGTFGDFSFFSLCRGKGLTIYEGGVLVAKDKNHFEIIDNKIKELVKSDFISESLKKIELIGYSIFYRKQLFWFIFSLPQVFWNVLGNKDKAMIEYFSENFPIHTVSDFRKNIGHKEFLRLDSEIYRQREKALYYLEEFSKVKGLKPVSEFSGSKATHPYLTLIFDDYFKRDKALRYLLRSGLGASTIYNCAITDYGYLRSFVPDENSFNARYISARGITLSTSTFISLREQKEVAKRILFVLNNS